MESSSGLMEGMLRPAKGCAEKSRQGGEDCVRRGYTDRTHGSEEDAIADENGLAGSGEDTENWLIAGR